MTLLTAGFDETRMADALDVWAAERWHGISHDSGHILRIGFPARDFVRHYVAGPFDDGSPRRDIMAGDAFRIASIGKTATAIAAFRLIEERRLSLDARLTEYLPDDLVARIHVRAGRSCGRLITMRHLLTHSSGVRDFVDHPEFRAKVYGPLVRDWTAADMLGLAVEAGEALFAPGEAQAYTDTGYVLLGEIIQIITGGTLANAYRSLVFDPLSLIHTYLEGRERVPAGTRLSHNFMGDRSVGLVSGIYDTWGGGGVISTADDLACWITQLFEGKPFQYPQTLALMYEGVGADMPKMGVAELCDIRSGIFRLRADAYDLWGHSGFWGSFMYLAPELGVVLTGTRNQGEPEEKQAEIFGGLLRVIARAASS